MLGRVRFLHWCPFDSYSQHVWGEPFNPLDFDGVHLSATPGTVTQTPHSRSSETQTCGVHRARGFQQHTCVHRLMAPRSMYGDMCCTAQGFLVTQKMNFQVCAPLWNMPFPFSSSTLRKSNPSFKIQIQFPPRGVFPSLSRMALCRYSQIFG